MINISVNGKVINSIDTVLFDKDGTIIDSNIYWREIIQRRADALSRFCGLDNEARNELCACMGLDIYTNVLREEGPIAIASRDEVIYIVYKRMQELNTKISIREIDKLFVKVHQEFLPHALDYVAVLPGVIPFMKSLYEEKVKIAIVTSDSVQNTALIMDKLACSQYIQYIAGKETVSETKESGKPAEYVMKKLGSMPIHTVCIGDTKTDLLMAKNSHCEAGIGVATGQISEDNLKMYTEYTVNSTNQIHLLH